MKLKKIGFFALATFAAARLFIWGLIGSCTALAPDEDSYYQVFRFINNSREIRPTNVWANAPEWLLRIIFIPAKVFSAFGMPEFQAFRLQSIFLAAGVVLILVVSLKKIEFSVRFQELNQKNKVSLLIFLAICGFMPSNIIWTVLGLREPFIYFSLALIFFSFNNILNSRSQLSIWILLYFIGLVILGFTKFYLFIIITCSILISLLILLIHNKKSKLFIVLIVSICATLLFSKQTDEVNSPTIGFSHMKLTLDYLPDFNSPKLPSMTYSQLMGCRDLNTAGPLLLASLNMLNSILPTRIELATSQLPVDEPSATALRNDEDLRGELNLFNLPIGFLSFLFFPISILDSGLFGLLGIFEVIFWIPLYWMLSIMLWRSRSDIKRIPIVVASLAFILIFVLFSSLTEVNFGTALRHRSVLLVPMTVIALSIWRNKPLKPTRKA